MNNLSWIPTSKITKTFSTKKVTNNGHQRKSENRSSPAHSMQDEYDFEYDNDELDDKFIDEMDESDEECTFTDTEEASETDLGKNEEFTEIKEQMYQDKLASLQKQMQQLKDGIHPEYIAKHKKLEQARNERLLLNNVWYDYELQCVERDYESETRAAKKEFEEKKIDLREMLISDLEEKRKLVEAERQNMELSGDSMEVKPVMTRKLRRRPNDPIPVPEKRRKNPPAQIYYMLEDKEIDADLRSIIRTKPITSTVPVRKPSLTSSTSISYNDNVLQDCRVEDGKLLYERRWFHRGQPVFVEGKDVSPYPAIILAVATDRIRVKKTTDGGEYRINIHQLSRGMYSIKRRVP